MSEDFRIRLMVVDDEQTIRRLCMTVGESLGFSCLEAESGDAALALLDEQQPIHMVLTDMVMPEGDGLEALRRLKASAVPAMAGAADVFAAVPKADGLVRADVVFTYVAKDLQRVPARVLSPHFTNGRLRRDII